MSKDLADLAGTLVDGHEPDWSGLDDDAARSLKRLHQVSLAFARARATATESGACQFNWCHLEVFELIGSGGFGDVYRAWDPVLKREVALKLRSEEAASISDQVLIEEARRMARVRHPNVLAVHGSDIDNGRAGIWCDLLEGQTLEQALVGEGALDLPRFLRLAVPLAGAVAEIHRRELVHGDIKAANVMVLPDKSPVLMDFGAGADLSDGATGVVAGSPLVMAPEILAGQPLSAAGDVYSLGVLYYRLLAGRYPLAASNVTQLQQMHESAAEVDMQDIAGPVRGLMRGMLERHPGMRPAATAVERQLIELKTRPERRKKTAAWASAVLALTVGMVIAGLAYVQARHSETQARQAQAESEDALQFLRSILSSPRVLEKGAEVKVVEVLDDARRELEFAPPQSPRRRAAMQLVLGQTYSLLGRTELAEVLLLNSAEYYSMSDCRCDEGVSAWIATARNGIRGEQFDQAARWIERAESAMQRDSEPRLRLILAQTRADLLKDRKDDEQAIGAYRDALTLSESLADKSLIPAHIRVELAPLIMRSDIVEAERLARDARAWIIERVGVKSEHLLEANNALAAVLIEKGEFEEAQALLTESLRVAQERTPEGSWETISILSTLSSVLDRRGRAAEAMEANSQALAMAEQSGGSPVKTLVLRLNHAVRQQELGRLIDAEEAYRRALADAVELVGPDSQYALLAHSNLADVLLVAGKHAEAEDTARRALEINRRVAGEEHLFTLFTMDLLGASQCRQGRCAEAIPLLRQSHTAKSRNFGANNPYTHDTACYLAEALIATGHAGEAQSLLEGAVAKRGADLGEDHKKTREAAALLERARQAGD